MPFQAACMFHLKLTEIWYFCNLHFLHDLLRKVLVVVQNVCSSLTSYYCILPVKINDMGLNFKVSKLLAILSLLFYLSCSVRFLTEYGLVVSPPESSGMTYRGVPLSPAAQTHCFKKLRTLSRCRRCESYVLFQGAECERVSSAACSGGGGIISKTFQFQPRLVFSRLIKAN